jgi:hypothetical protein
MGWSGDISQMGELEARLAELADVPARTARAVSNRLEELIQDEFDRGTDPYEDAWKPLAPATTAKGRTPPPLTDTSAMRGTLLVRPLAGAGVGITIDQPAGYHQTGWSGPRGTGPARPVLPARGELPDGWIEVIEEEATRAFRGVTRR